MIHKEKRKYIVILCIGLLPFNIVAITLFIQNNSGFQKTIYYKDTPNTVAQKTILPSERISLRIWAPNTITVYSPQECLRSSFKIDPQDTIIIIGPLNKIQISQHQLLFPTKTNRSSRAIASKSSSESSSGSIDDGRSKKKKA